MPKVNNKNRISIAGKVRALRRERGITQKELSSRIGLSQSRLSEIERGKGSFTAEQFILLLQIFNVPISHFVDEVSSDRAAEIQDALARHGASHLHESSTTLAGEALEDVRNTIKEALLSGNPRFVTALGPVIVSKANSISIKNTYLFLAEHGLEKRFIWAMENIYECLDEMLQKPLSRISSRLIKRARIVLSSLLDFAYSKHRDGEESRARAEWDIFDHDIRSKKTERAIRRDLSDTSRRWGIVSALSQEDFCVVLMDAHGD